MFCVKGNAALDAMNLGRNYAIRVQSLRELIDHYDREVAMLERDIHTHLRGHIRWRRTLLGMSIDFLDAIPVLPYVDIRAAHDFLVNVIGLDSAGLIEHEGRVIHGEVRAGDRRFWLHESAGALTEPSEAGVRTGGVVLHVADVDSHFERVRAAGAIILREPTDEDYGQREYGVRDPGGHDWYVATPFATPAE